MTAANPALDAPCRVDFEGLDIAWDHRVLSPRAWTAEQGRWAAEIARTAPPGPLLELCCGAGQIGLLAARLSGRPLVQVDRDPVAVAFARRNAAAAGVVADVRCGSMLDVLAPDERFGLVIADPPWLRSVNVADFPADPPGAVDGGLDGCEFIRTCIDIALAHLAPGGHVVLQVGDLVEAEEAQRHLEERLGAGTEPVVRAVRDRRPEGVLMNLGPSGSSSEPAREGRSEGAGEVSEVGNLADVEEIRPEDAVAGHPDDREVQEGATGPNARTGDQDNPDEDEAP